MQLFAEADVLKLDIITMGGMLEVFIEVKYIMPITPYDYWNASWVQLIFIINKSSFRNCILNLQVFLTWKWSTRILAQKKCSFLINMANGQSKELRIQV